MGCVIDGEWVVEPRKRSAEGRFERAGTQCRNWITADGSSGFKAEPGRYHIFYAHACPWAHRTLMVRKLKKLDEVISVSHVEPLMLDMGWEFPEGGDPLTGARYLHQVYIRSDSGYTGRASVPVLWDKQREVVVSNESSEIIRMLNSAFNEWGDALVDLYPASLRDAIDEVNAVVYETVNNGVYRTGFATSQAAYEEAFDALFATLDDLDARLDRQRYLVGDRITEADWRLFATLVRFDAVYFGHFKCNLRRISDYPNLSNYTRELYQVPGIAETIDLPRIKQHYYGSHRDVNPTGIVPKGPELDFTAPHDRMRESLEAAE